MLDSHNEKAPVTGPLINLSSALESPCSALEATALIAPRSSCQSLRSCLLMPFPFPLCSDFVQMAGAEPGMTLNRLLQYAVGAESNGLRSRQHRQPAHQPAHSSASGCDLMLIDRRSQSLRVHQLARLAINAHQQHSFEHHNHTPMQPQHSVPRDRASWGRVSRQTHCSGATSGAQFLNLDFDPARWHGFVTDYAKVLNLG